MPAAQGMVAIYVAGALAGSTASHGQKFLLTLPPTLTDRRAHVHADDKIVNFTPDDDP